MRTSEFQAGAADRLSDFTMHTVQSAGFCTEHSAKAHGIGYEAEKSPTLRAGVVPAAMALESHPTDSRIGIADDDICQTLTSRMGTGGGNVPLLMEEVHTATPFSKTTRPHSASEAENWEDSSTANTLNTFDTGETRANELIVQAFGICAKESNSMKSDNPHSGFYKAETSRTIDTSDQSPSKNQGGMAVVAIQGSMIGRSPKNGPQGSGISENVSFTLDTADRHAVVYSTSKASYHTDAEINKTNTLMATDYKDPPTVAGDACSFYPQMKAESQCFRPEISVPLVNGTNPGFHNGIVQPDSEVRYIVRRLVPQECARLQGFPDWWCGHLESEDPDDAEIDRWTKIFETFRKAVKPSSKPKSRNAVIKWLKHPHSDSAEYKMWGNGIALPCAYFVLAGIACYGDAGKSNL